MTFCFFLDILFLFTSVLMAGSLYIYMDWMVGCDGVHVGW